MMAVILAGGKGTRLSPFTISIPKPLMPIGDLPILEIVVKQLKAAGFDRIVLSLGHMSHFFLTFIEEWEHYGIKIELCHEHTPLGTAGALGLIEGLEDHFLVMNGDLLTTLDFRAFYKRHVASGDWATIALSRREMKVDYGVVRTLEDGTLDEFEEKPVLNYDVSMGINMFSKACLNHIPREQRLDIPDLMMAIKEGGNRVGTHTTTCYWQDIGRIDDLERATADFIADRSRFIP